MVRGAVTARILGTGMTRLGKHGLSATELMQEALEKALGSCGLRLRDLDGLVAVPSLSDPHFMEAHYLATRVGLLPNRGVRVHTLDTGGAGPITGLLLAARLVQSQRCEAVAVVAGDAVASMDTKDFLQRADQGTRDPNGALPSPCIPHGYGRVAEWIMQKYGITREQLAMVSVLMSRQAVRHPNSLTRQPHTLEDVLGSRNIAPATNLLECARRADGGAAVIVASSRLAHKMPQYGVGPLCQSGGAVILGGGEASGPLYPPPVIDETMFSCEEAAKQAYAEAQLLPGDIDWFGLYDCYPICFLRAVAACGLCPKGQAGKWVEDMMKRTGSQEYSPNDFPVNTHGGLLAFGAPWEVPAMYNVIEACDQLAGAAGSRQVKDARRALVYGNGGIFSHSAVAILARPVE
eukprot:TRINITY_DN31651_c0_g2_i1.p1 TRINITY_DN31651_c0_g2~~TRINITY_DN31651_c0_g2_i1.p1  ORF type:complete len:406 (+),score=67.04 TRINITY_DN31651_c0_g2_i1:68-1285(+)